MAKKIKIPLIIFLLILAFFAAREAYISYQLIKRINNEKLTFIDINIKGYSVIKMNVKYSWGKDDFLIIKTLEYPNNFRIEYNLLAKLIKSEDSYWYLFDLLDKKEKLTIGIFKSELQQNKYVNIYAIKYKEANFFGLSNYHKRLIVAPISIIILIIFLIGIYFFVQRVYFKS